MVFVCVTINAPEPFYKNLHHPREGAAPLGANLSREINIFLCDGILDQLAQTQIGWRSDEGTKRFSVDLQVHFGTNMLPGIHRTLIEESLKALLTGSTDSGDSKIVINWRFCHMF